MRKDKYKPDQKRLCQTQENLIQQHIAICHICEESFKEYEKYGVSNTPPCKIFYNQMRKHVSNCGFCNSAEKKWNEDAVSITPDMRQVVGDIKKGKMPDIGLLKRVSSHLFKELGLSSDEIHDMSEKADKAARDGLSD